MEKVPLPVRNAAATVPINASRAAVWVMLPMPTAAPPVVPPVTVRANSIVRPAAAMAVIVASDARVRDRYNPVLQIFFTGSIAGLGPMVTFAAHSHRI